ncbi:MAG TPA: hypothetical protein VNS34_10430 [Rhizobiaceae bacterium]|nr:hypothetical protein [Rhizobiaceae bacterium]
MAVMEPDVRADVTSLGTVAFTLEDVSSVLNRTMSVNGFRALDPVNHRLIIGVLAEVEQALSARLDTVVHVSDATVSPGSLKVENGQVVITSPRLAMIVCAMTVIMHYNDLRENVIQIYKDIDAVVHSIPFAENVSGIRFKPADPDHVIADLEPFLPQRVRELVRKRRG